MLRNAVFRSQLYAVNSEADSIRCPLRRLTSRQMHLPPCGSFFGSRSIGWYGRERDRSRRAEAGQEGSFIIGSRMSADQGRAALRRTKDALNNVPRIHG